MKERTQRSLLWALAGAGLVAGIGMMATHQRRYNLEGRVALITGGARGLGLVIARELGLRGVKLVICSRSEEQLRLAAQELNGMGTQVLAIPCDVTDKKQIRDLVDQAVDHFGHIDILINNAGIIQVGPMDAMNEQEYIDAMDIHFWAPLHSTLAALPYFRAQGEGRIVNIASIGGKIAVPHLLPYSASKFALVGLSEGLSAALRHENIIVSTVTPSLMRTGSPRNVTIKGDHEKEYAWFKTAASMPLISEHPESVARKVVKALETENARPTISLVERFASLTKEVFPQTLDMVLAKVNTLLPQNSHDGNIAKRGYEVESRLSGNIIARNADADAIAHNEN